MDISIIIIINQTIGAFIIYILLSKKLNVEKEQYIKLVNNYQKLSSNFLDSQKKSQSQNDIKSLEKKVSNLSNILDKLHNKLSDYFRFNDIYEEYLNFQHTGKVPHNPSAGGTSNITPNSDDKLNSIKKKRTTPEP